MKTISSQYCVIFRLEDRLYALPLDNVTRILRMVAITPMPDSPPDIAGMINMAGHILPVFDLHSRFGMRIQAPRISDRLIIVEEQEHNPTAIKVDEVLQVIPLELEQAEPPPALAQFAPVQSIIKKDSEMILVLDLHRVLQARTPNPTP